MKKLVIVSSVIAVALVAILVKTKSSKTAKEATEIAMEINRAPLVCSTKTETIKEISPTKGKVTNSNYLTFQQATFESGNQAAIISANVEPYMKGQTFLLATDCRDMKAEETIPVKERLADTKDGKGNVITNYEEVHKAQADIAKQECVNIYVWNKQAQQMKIECGHLIDEKIYLVVNKEK